MLYLAVLARLGSAGRGSWQPLQRVDPPPPPDKAETGAAERAPFLCRGPRKSPLSRLASGPQLPADAREIRPKIRFLHPPHARHVRVTS